MKFEYESVPTHNGDVGDDPAVRPIGTIVAEFDEAVADAVLISMSTDDSVGEVAYVRTIDARGWAKHILALCDQTEQRRQG